MLHTSQWPPLPSQRPLQQKLILTVIIIIIIIGAVLQFAKGPFFGDAPLFFATSMLTAHRRHPTPSIVDGGWPVPCVVRLPWRRRFRHFHGKGQRHADAAAFRLRNRPEDELSGWANIHYYGVLCFAGSERSAQHTQRRCLGCAARCVGPLHYAGVGWLARLLYSC